MNGKRRDRAGGGRRQANPEGGAPVRGRDAERSREAILAAAEELFAARGFEATGLGEVAARAGLSRGTPSYFFGSKRGLYAAVLERVFRDREEATVAACAPLREWAAAARPGSLERALNAAVTGYLDFLRSRPSFLLLLQREELAGAARLREAPRESRAIAAAFEAVRAIARRRGLRAFAVDDAVLVFVALTFSPLAQRSTLMAALGRDLDDDTVRRRHVRLVTRQLLALLT